MTWPQIRQFINEGGVLVNIRPHTYMPLNNVADIKKDILNSHKSWIKNVGFIPKLLHILTAKQVMR